MLKRHNPGTIASPLSRYSHGVEAPAGARWLHVSGQVGIRPDGTLAEGIEGQMAQAFTNILEILQHAGMTKHDLVKLNAFLLDAQNIGVYRTVRDRMILPAEPASTLLIVTGLANPDILVEIEAIAAAG